MAKLKGNEGLVTYMKLSTCYSNFLKKKYGGNVIVLPVVSKLYGCLEHYLMCNSEMKLISRRAFSARLIERILKTGLEGIDGPYKDVLNPLEENEEYVPIVIPDRVYRPYGLATTSSDWQLSDLGAVEFNKIVKHEFWMEFFRFVDESYLGASVEGYRITRKKALTDFMFLMEIPMNQLTNMLRYERRMRIEIEREMKERKNRINKEIDRIDSLKMA